MMRDEFRSSVPVFAGVWTLHDLRRTFATITSEQLGVQPVVR
jgi:hypothetical protein